MADHQITTDLGEANEPHTRVFVGCARLARVGTPDLVRLGLVGLVEDVRNLLGDG